MTEREPCYRQALRDGLLAQRVAEGRELLKQCSLCPRRCAVDRSGGELGYCRVGTLAQVASYGPHFGEEAPLVGSGGSGTIFFCGCNLLCVFCQNYQLSQGTDQDCVAADANQLATVMLELQARGCHNINLVTPSHVVPQILAALELAARQGLHVPLVYNCGGYESLTTLALLDGIVDIYMPDAKFFSEETARRLAQAPDYPERLRESLLEMQRQVGDLEMTGDGLAIRGLLVRHLLMPGLLDESRQIFAFLAKEVSTNCYLNIMDQYRPCGEAHHHSGLAGTISPAVVAEAKREARRLGLSRLDERDMTVLLRRLLGPQRR